MDAYTSVNIAASFCHIFVRLKKLC